MESSERGEEGSIDRQRSPAGHETPRGSEMTGNSSGKETEEKLRAKLQKLAADKLKNLPDKIQEIKSKGEEVKQKVGAMKTKAGSAVKNKVRRRRGAVMLPP